MRQYGLTVEQVETLRDLARCWGREGFVLIGARAIGCFVPLSWRETEDLDVTVMTSLADYPAGLDDLPEWRQDPVITQRWYSRSGVRVDVLPAGKDGRDAGALEWPGEDRIVSRVGLRLASDHAAELPFDHGLVVRVAPVPVVGVLKMISYLDRPHERQRDLSDLAHVLTEYPESDRRFELEGVFEHGLDYDQAGPFILGQEIRALGLHGSERDLVDRFLAFVENDETVTARMAREAGRTWSQQDVRRLIEALRLGLLHSADE